MAKVNRKALESLNSIPFVRLTHQPTPIEEMNRLRSAVGAAPRLLVKRDDAIPLAFGGNKVRKLEQMAALARAEGADTLVTTGGVQSNHARLTAAVAARLGMRCLLVLNGDKPERLSANALLSVMLGAELEYVGTREERAPAMREAAERLRRQGRRPFEIPLGASTPAGALGYIRAVEELLGQIAPPDVIVVSSSSGGTQAGLVAGCELFGLTTRVVGISADEPAEGLGNQIRSILTGIGRLLDIDGAALADSRPIAVDDGFVGEGYGIPSSASEEASLLAARTEALFLDPVYTAKAMAGMLGWLRDNRFGNARTVLFWHTGGQIALFR
jgi:1-aminocyclopropane-1-carboxylate deaminase/D-cysteine desulfhydrase-like pyridoxal-dependent ACC family enzyme